MRTAIYTVDTTSRQDDAKWIIENITLDPPRHTAEATVGLRNETYTITLPFVYTGPIIRSSISYYTVNGGGGY